MNLCLPSTMCGPFCSVPAVGMMTVVVPAAIASRTSVQVSSSRNIVSGAWASAVAPTSVSAVIRIASRGMVSSPALWSVVR